MTPTEAALLPAHEQLRAIRAGERSAVELLEACLARIDGLNPTLNAIVTLNPAAGDEAARVDEALARGEDPGPLAGLAVGIKDVTETAGIRTTYGSPLYADHVPDEDAEVVRRLRAAGAVILGKTNTPEFAAGASTWNDVFGRTANPWDPARTAGGSTGGGAAALAAGMISLAEGTDLGGSLRVPAAFCGVVGLRPSPGLVPTWPTRHPWDTLSAAGFLGRTAADVGLALDACAGPDPRLPFSQPAGGRDFAAAGASHPDPRGWRLAYAPDPAGIGVDPAIAALCEATAAALGGAGASVEQVPLDLSEARPAFLALRGHWFLAHLGADPAGFERYGENVANNLRAGLDVTAREMAEAERVRSGVRAKLAELFDEHDALLTPCTAVSPFPAVLNYPEAVAGRPMATYVDWIAPTYVFSLSGLPAASVPAGLDPDGLPVGLQVVAPALGEEAALRICAAVQELRPIGLPRPSGLRESSVQRKG